MSSTPSLRNLLLTLFTTGLACALPTTHAEACSIAPTVVGPLAVTIPADGVLPVVLVCSYETICTTPSEAFEVLDGSGSPVPGSVVETVAGASPSSRVTVAWKPTAGWTSGASYQFHSLARGGLETPVSLSVVASVPADHVALTSTLVASRDYGTGVHCGTMETTCGTMNQYFYPDVAQVAELAFTLDASSVWSSQAVLSVEGTTARETIRGAELGLMLGEPDWSVYRLNQLAPIAFKEQASEYCYRVLSRRLGETAVTVVGEGCIPHGALPPLGRFEDPDEFGFDHCNGPVAGHTTEWCSWVDASELCSPANRASFPEQCANYDAACVGDVTPTPSNTGKATEGSGCQYVAGNRAGTGLLRSLLSGAGLAVVARILRRRRSAGQSAKA